MRLKKEDRVAIIRSSKKEFPSGRLLLYGSRVNDDLKGGDIDLVLILPNTENIVEATKMIPGILAAIKIQIGEQKIDFSIISEQQSLSEPFWIHALKTSQEF
ncbi:MAG: DNA polymerase subunit beta [Bdellovibrio sp.]|nr:MAG: DNA polymerase subunit beta [Bdellovibrio sp.]